MTRPDDGNHQLFAWTPRLIANLLPEAAFRVERLRSRTYARPLGTKTAVLIGSDA